MIDGPRVFDSHTARHMWVRTNLLGVHCQ
jgi:hypothetical protein